MRKIVFIFLLSGFFSILTLTAQVVETVQLPPAQKSGGMSLLEALNKRQSQRSFSSKDLTQQELSNVLWAAYGINRPEGLRTVSSSKEWYEYDIYISKLTAGIFMNLKNIYCLKWGMKIFVFMEVLRILLKQPPVILVYIADFDRMTQYH